MGRRRVGGLKRRSPPAGRDAAWRRARFRGRQAVLRSVDGMSSSSSRASLRRKRSRSRAEAERQRGEPRRDGRSAIEACVSARSRMHFARRRRNLTRRCATGVQRGLLRPVPCNRLPPPRPRAAQPRVHVPSIHRPVAPASDQPDRDGRAGLPADPRAVFRCRSNATRAAMRTSRSAAAGEVPIGTPSTRSRRVYSPMRWFRDDRRVDRGIHLFLVRTAAAGAVLFLLVRALAEPGRGFAPLVFAIASADPQLQACRQHRELDAAAADRVGLGLVSAVGDERSLSWLASGAFARSPLVQAGRRHGRGLLALGVWGDAIVGSAMPGSEPARDSRLRAGRCAGLGAGSALLRRERRADTLLDAVVLHNPVCTRGPGAEGPRTWAAPSRSSCRASGRFSVCARGLAARGGVRRSVRHALAAGGGNLRARRSASFRLITSCRRYPRRRLAGVGAAGWSGRRRAPRARG
jgi:hypothetical protein